MRGLRLGGHGGGKTAGRSGGQDQGPGGKPRPRSQDQRDLLTDCFLFFVIVHKPEKVSWTEAAGTVRDGVRAYTALHYLSRLSPGKWVLIMDGASVGANSLFRNRPKHSKRRNGPSIY